MHMVKTRKTKGALKMNDFLKNAQHYEENAEFLRTISHPIRLMILKLLIQNKSMNVSSLYEALRLPQSTVSQHLSKLKATKVVVHNRKGLEVFYSIENEKVVALMDVIAK